MHTVLGVDFVVFIKGFHSNLIQSLKSPGIQFRRAWLNVLFVIFIVLKSRWIELHDDIIKITKFFSGSFRLFVNTPLMPSFERLVNSFLSSLYTVFLVNVRRWLSLVRNLELAPLYPIRMNNKLYFEKFSICYCSGCYIRLLSWRYWLKYSHCVLC